MTDARGLSLISTSSGKDLGSIRLKGGKAVFDGKAEVIFRSRQRAAKEPMSDEALYDWFAAGWSNGPLAIVPTGTGSATAEPDSPLPPDADPTL